MLLLDRKANRLDLTAAGNRFLDRARRVLAEAEEAETTARQAARGEVGCIEIGFMPSALCAGLIHKCIGEFRRANSEIDITLHQLVPMAQLTALIRNELDFAFTRGPHKYPRGLDGFTVLRQPLVLALPSDHPLARRNRIDPRVLKNEVFVNTLAELEVGFPGHTEAVAAVADFSPRVGKRVDNFITVLTYVSVGYGIGVVTEPMTKLDVPNVVYREFTTNPPPTSSIDFVYRRNDSSPAGKRLIKFMRRYALPR